MGNTMTILGKVTLLGGCGLALLLAGSCTAPCEDRLACGEYEDDGTLPDSGDCDRTKSPTDTECLLENRYAVFAAPSGEADGPGTREAPVGSLNRAIELAKEENKFVIACSGTFAESVQITSKVKIYGGFSCPGTGAAWKYDASSKA